MLGLQELVVVGMADGYAQASGRPTHVNLHTAPGVGNAVGGIFNAQANKSPARDHRRPAGPPAHHDRGEPDQPGRRPSAPQPYVKWSHEPTARAGRPGRDRPRDPPRHAAAARARRSSRSRWTTGTPRPTRTGPATRSARRGHRARGARSRGAGRSSRAVLEAAAQPGAGRRCRTSTPAAAGTPRSRWPRSSGCPCGRRRRPAAAGSASRRAIPNFVGILPPAIGADVARRSRGTTSCSSSAPRCSPTTRTSRGRCCPRARRWSRSRATPARRRARRWATRSSATSRSR